MNEVFMVIAVLLKNEHLKTPSVYIPFGIPFKLNHMSRREKSCFQYDVIFTSEFRLLYATNNKS